MRTILHIDMNNFYASVECLYNPEIRDKPVAVCGNPELRHGIILAKNMIAKRMGVKTGEAIWQAQQKCRNLVLVPPHFDWYLRFSKLAKDMYYGYTDKVESFGLDECWLDVTGSASLHGDGVQIADTLRERVKAELGITASVGVSYNKIFAKLGSDMKKPDATTVIPKESFQDIVWPQPVEDLLFVGPATHRKLSRYYIKTIGELAQHDPEWLRRIFGVNGVVLWQFANGLDNSPVCNIESHPIIKSIGNSATTPRDLTTDADILITIYSLAESVAARMREQGVRCNVVKLHVRSKDLNSFERQHKLNYPTCVSTDIANEAFNLFQANVRQGFAVRSLGIQACDLISDSIVQSSMLPEEERSNRREMVEITVDKLRQRFGHYVIQRGIMLQDSVLSINPKDDHTIHPTAFIIK